MRTRSARPLRAWRRREAACASARRARTRRSARAIRRAPRSRGSIRIVRRRWRRRRRTSACRTNRHGAVAGGALAAHRCRGGRIEGAIRNYRHDARGTAGSRAPFGITAMTPWRQGSFEVEGIGSERSSWGWWVEGHREAMTFSLEKSHRLLREWSCAIAVALTWRSSRSRDPARAHVGGVKN